MLYVQLTSVLLSLQYIQGKNIFDLTGKWSDAQGEGLEQ
jgi:hypothetical protein